MALAPGVRLGPYEIVSVMSRFDCRSRIGGLLLAFVAAVVAYGGGAGSGSWPIVPSIEY